MSSKVLSILIICLFGSSLCVPIGIENNVQETGKPFRYNENEQRQLDTAVSALLGGLLPQLQSTLSTAIQGAATNLLGNFSIWDILRDNGQVPNEYLEDSPEFDSYVVNLPNVGSFVMLAANKPSDYENNNNNKKPIILNKPIGLEQLNSGYNHQQAYKPSLSLPYKPDGIEFDKPQYVQDYKPINKPYDHHIGSTVTLASHDNKHDVLKNLFNFDKKKEVFSEQLAILQHKFHEQKEKIIAETINHINKLQAQLIGQLNDDYHTTSQYYTEYDTPEIIKKPIKKPLGHYVGFKSNAQRDSDFN